MGTEQKRVYVVVDYAKMLAAGIVVFGHCYLADVAGMAWFAGLVKAAVQMFFVFNGYFLYKNKTLLQEDKMKRYCRHFLVLLCCWILIYYLWNMLFTEHQDGWFFTYSVQSAQFICGLNDGHLWYVQNLLAVAVMLYFLGKTHFCLAEALAATLLAGMTGGLLFRALAGVGFGLWLAETEEAAADKRERGVRLNKIVCAVLGVVGAVLMMIAYQRPEMLPAGVWLEGIAGTASLLAGMALALGAIEADVHLLQKGLCLPDSGGIRRNSSLVYFIHLMIVPLSTAAVKFLLINRGLIRQGGLLWSLSVGSLTFAAGIAAGAVIPVLARKKCFTWLKNLY